jgi:hypothetical protein
MLIAQAAPDDTLTFLKVLSPLLTSISIMVAATGLANSWPGPFRRLTGYVALVVSVMLLMMRFVPASIFRQGIVADVGLSSGLLSPGVAGALLVFGLYRLHRPANDAASGDLRRIVEHARAFATVDADRFGVPARPRRLLRIRAIGLEAKVPYGRKTKTVRLNRALVKATSRWAASAEPVISLLIGPPGSGKSFALRKRARRLMPAARRAATGIRIPVYVDLGQLAISSTPADADLLRTHVAEILCGGDPLLNSTVLRLLRESRDTVRWIFFFDSFDELPAVLAATDAERVVEEHLKAIRQFVASLPSSRAVIAGREFSDLAVQTFATTTYVQPLSARRQRSFIRAAGLSRTATRGLQQRVFRDPSIRSLADSPFTLRMLCDYVANTGSSDLPGTVFDILDRAIRSHIEAAVGTPRSPGAGSSSLDVDHIHKIAQQLAFCVAADDRPTGAQWSTLATRMSEHGFAGIDSVEAAVLILSFSGLVQRVERPTLGGGGPVVTFSFTHRLIQDHLAAGLLRQHSQLVGQLDLLTAERWRQIAMIVFRHGSPEVRLQLFSAAERLLQNTVPSLPGAVDLAQLQNHNGRVRRIERFSWPKPTIAPLRILIVGIPSGTDETPPSLQAMVDTLVLGAFVSGATYDRSIALEVLQLASRDVALFVLDRWETFENIPVLRSNALQQAVTSELLPPRQAPRIRALLLWESIAGRRGWYPNPSAPDTSLTTDFAVMRSIAAWTVGLWAIQVPYELVRPLLREDDLRSRLWTFCIFTALALAWYMACRGRAVYRSLVSLAVIVVGVAGVIVLIGAVIAIVTGVWYIIVGRWSAAAWSGLSVVKNITVLWPALAMAALICGGGGKDVLRRPHLLVLRWLRQLLLDRAVGPFRAAAAAVAASALVLAILAWSLDARHLAHSEAQLARDIVFIVMLVIGVVFGIAALTGDIVHDARWWRHNRPASGTAIDEAGLLRWLAKIRTSWGLARMIADLDRRSSDNPEALRGVAALLSDVDHALDHLHRIMPGNSAWAVPERAWESFPIFRSNNVEQWLRSPATARRKLRWLTLTHREAIMRLRERAESVG